MNPLRARDARKTLNETNSQRCSHIIPTSRQFFRGSRQDVTSRFFIVKKGGRPLQTLREVGN